MAEGIMAHAMTYYAAISACSMGDGGARARERERGTEGAEREREREKRERRERTEGPAQSTA